MAVVVPSSARRRPALLARRVVAHTACPDESGSRPCPVIAVTRMNRGLCKVRATLLSRLTKSGEGYIIRMMPFVNSWERKIHFLKHGHEFGIGTEEEYEHMADTFMFGGMTPPTQECTRPNLVDRLRFNGTNRHFGVASIAPVFIRTFYPVRPAKIARHGGPNLFFAFECGRVNL